MIYRIPHILLLAATGVLLSVVSAKAVQVSDYSAFSTELFPPMGLTWNNTTSDQYVQNSGFISITSVSGGDPKGDGYFNAGFSGGGTINLTGQTILSLNGRVDAGNASSIVRFSFFDNVGTQVASGTYLASSFGSSFSTQNTALTLTGVGSLNLVTYYRADGDGIASNSFRYSFNDLSATAVPEPSAYAVGAVGLLGLCLVRRELRRRRSAVA